GGVVRGQDLVTGTAEVAGERAAVLRTKRLHHAHLRCRTIRHCRAVRNIRQGRRGSAQNGAGRRRIALRSDGAPGLQESKPLSGTLAASSRCNPASPSPSWSSIVQPMATAPAAVLKTSTSRAWHGQSTRDAVVTSQKPWPWRAPLRPTTRLPWMWPFRHRVTLSHG